MPRKRSHAVIIGCSVAGMCAARAISEHFERVTVIERDRLPHGVRHRAGVPQSHHVHALLLRGQKELERLFPGFERSLSEHGAGRVDLGRDVAHCTEWGWAPRAAIGVEPITVSRVLLESVLREQLRAQPRKIELLEETRITGLTTVREGERVRVTGVSTSHPELRELAADLVVDAAGRSSKCLEWLQSRGVERPEQEVVDAFGGYASRFYELAPDPRRWWRGMLVDPKSPNGRRWGLLMPVENGRWVLTLAGMNREYPPHDEQGFEQYLNSLPTRALAREIARATPVSDIHSFRALYNRAHHFETWKQQVGGFVSLGDAAIAFNAYHGQGMSMAAVAARTLGDTLAASPAADGFEISRCFQRAQWRALQPAWQIATEIDMEWPGTEGRRPAGYAWTLAAGIAVVRASHEFPQIKRWIGPVYQLVAPRYSLLRPDLVGLVLFSELRRRLGLARGLEPVESAWFAQEHLDAAAEASALREARRAESVMV